MDHRTYDRICEVVYDEAGIRIKPGKESMVSSRLAKRIRTLGLQDETDYLEHLERHLRQEVVALLDVISTNVTQFYREAEHFEIFARHHEALVRARQKRLRYWCAASSTGEEPYTIAMTVAEVESRCGIHTDTKLLATDISTRVLECASKGVYGQERVSGIPPAKLARWFCAGGPNREVTYEATADLKRMILFRRLNLAKPPFAMRGPLAAVFCRNVMFYFDDPVRVALLTEIHRLLVPGGLLFIGKSESLPHLGVEFERLGASVFRKSATGGAV